MRRPGLLICESRESSNSPVCVMTVCVVSTVSEPLKSTERGDSQGAFLQWVVIVMVIVWWCDVVVML